MKKLGIFLLVTGFICAIFAFNIDTTVSTESKSIGGIYIPSTRVNNIGLMDERRNFLIFSGFQAVVGAILLLVGGAKNDNKLEAINAGTKRCPYCAEIINNQAIFCRYCQKDLEEKNNIKEEDVCSKISSDIFYCSNCMKSDSYYDSYNKIYCPNCNDYTGVINSKFLDEVNGNNQPLSSESAKEAACLTTPDIVTKIQQPEELSTENEIQHFSKCVKCGAEKSETTDCPACGVIYERAERLFLERLRKEKGMATGTAT